MGRMGSTSRECYFGSHTPVYECCSVPSDMSILLSAYFDLAILLHVFETGQRAPVTVGSSHTRMSSSSRCVRQAPAGIPSASCIQQREIEVPRARSSEVPALQGGESGESSLAAGRCFGVCSRHGRGDGPKKGRHTSTQGPIHRGKGPRLKLSSSIPA